MHAFMDAIILTVKLFLKFNVTVKGWFNPFQLGVGSQEGSSWVGRVQIFPAVYDLRFFYQKNTKKSDLSHLPGDF